MAQGMKTVGQGHNRDILCSYALKLCLSVILNDYPISSESFIFAAITGVNLGLGRVTPPTAPMLFLAGRIGKSSAEEYIKPALILMWAGMVPVLLLTTYWPGLCLYIPKALGFIK